MEHTAVMLPLNLLERLREDAKAADQGVSAEIRRRLQLTYDQEGLQRDPKTSELLSEIERLALTTPLDVPWYADGDAFKVFKGAIDATLSKYQPSSKTPGPTGRLQNMYGQDATPETVGRILAGVTGTFHSRKID
jgi:hypothetical protein